MCLLLSIFNRDIYPESKLGYAVRSCAAEGRGKSERWVKLRVRLHIGCADGSLHRVRGEITLPCPGLLYAEILAREQGTKDEWRSGEVKI
jgi:hypothetical protein